jgi:hypothetical protein
MKRYSTIKLLNDKIRSITEPTNFDQLLLDLEDMYYDGRRKFEDSTVEHFLKMLSKDGVFFWKKNNGNNYCTVDIDYDYKKIESPTSDKELLKKVSVSYRIFSQIKPFLRDNKLEELGV